MNDDVDINSLLVLCLWPNCHTRINTLGRAPINGWSVHRIWRYIQSTEQTKCPCTHRDSNLRSLQSTIRSSSLQTASPTVSANPALRLWCSPNIISRATLHQDCSKLSSVGCSCTYTVTVPIRNYKRMKDKRLINPLKITSLCINLVLLQLNRHAWKQLIFNNTSNVRLT